LDSLKIANRIVTRYKENMLPFDNRGYRGRAILEGAGTDVYSGPRQAEVEVGQPQAYSQSTSIQRQAKLSSAVSVIGPLDD
jgi:hypothetical protein